MDLGKANVCLNTYFGLGCQKTDVNQWSAHSPGKYAYHALFIAMFDCRVGSRWATPGAVLAGYFFRAHEIC